MLNKFYVAHEVIARKKFIKYGFSQDLIGCHFNNYFFISKKVVLIERDRDGNYLYSNSRQKCTVIDPNDLVSSVATLECNNCMFKSDDVMNCQSLNHPAIDEPIGIIDIQPIISFTRMTSLPEAIALCGQYNSQVKDEYQYVDDDCYVDTIREIDDSVIRMFNNVKAKVISDDKKIQKS